MKCNWANNQPDGIGPVYIESKRLALYQIVSFFSLVYVYMYFLGCHKSSHMKRAYTAYKLQLKDETFYCWSFRSSFVIINLASNYLQFWVSQFEFKDILTIYIVYVGIFI